MTPERYDSILREYDAILAHAGAMSARLTGRVVAEQHLSYAETIFTKMLCHAFSLRKLSPTLEPGATELWDIGAACTIARTLIEAFDALAYVSLHPVSPAERALRLMIWELHDQEHRLHMLEDIGSAGADVEAIRTNAILLRDKVQHHGCYLALSKKVRGDISGGKAPEYVQTQSERNKASGVDHDYSKTVKMFLSQYVHTLPFALKQLQLVHAGDPGALQVMSMPLQYAMPFLAKAIVGIGVLWPDTQVAMSADLQRAMDLWLEVVAKGVRGPWQ